MFSTSLALLSFLFLLLVALATAQLGPNDIPDSAADSVPDATIPDPRVSLLNQMKTDSQLEVFVKLLDKAGMSDYLSSPTGRATVFSPTNSAIAQFAREITQNRRSIRDDDVEDVITALEEGLKDVARVDNGELPNMIQLVKYHIIGDAYPMQEIENKRVWQTMAGIKLRTYQGMLVDFDDTFNTSVSQRNIFCLNGWLHIIPNVLVPYDLTAIKQKLPLVESTTPTSTQTATPSVGFTQSPSPSASLVPVAASDAPKAPPSNEDDTPTTGGTTPPATTEPTGSGSDPTDTTTDGGETGSDETDEGADNENDDDTVIPTGTTVPDDDEDGDDAVCFPSSARVHMASGKTVRMDQLSGGDEVMHCTSSLCHRSNSKSSKIFLFTHRNANVKNVPFVRISTTCGQRVTLSRSHYMRAENGALVAARAVRVGDRLHTVSGLCAVSHVESVKEDGLFAPHSMHGDVVVDGVTVSSYSKAVHPSVAHALLFPVRWVVRHLGVTEPLGSLLYSGADWIVGFVPSGKDRH